jgi:hypothetical protein
MYTAQKLSGIDQRIHKYFSDFLEGGFVGTMAAASELPHFSDRAP